MDQCQPQWHLQNPDEAGEAILLCDYLQERKRWRPTNYFFVLVTAKLKSQILFQGISDTNKIVIYHAVTIGNSEAKNSLIWLHISFYNED